MSVVTAESQHPARQRMRRALAYPFEGQCCLGLCLVLLSSPLASVVRDVVGVDSPLVLAAFILFGILLIFDPQVIRSGKLHTSKSILATIVFFQGAIIVLAWAPVGTLDNSLGLTSAVYAPDFVGIIESLIILTFAIAVASNPLERWRPLPIYFAVVGGSIIAIAVIYLVTNPQALARIFLGVRFKGFAEASGGTPTMIAMISAWTMIAIVYSLGNFRASTRNLAMSIMLYVFLVVCTFSFLAAQSRKMYAAFGLAILLAITVKLFQTRQMKILRLRGPSVKRSDFLAIVLAPVTVIFGLFALGWGEQLLALLGNAAEGLFNAFASFLLGDTQADRSGAMRIGFLERVFDQMDPVGHGYMAFWFDNPVLQSYYDLGLVGFFAFTLVTVVIPLGIIIVLVFQKQSPIHILFICFFYVVFFNRLFLSHTPYFMHHWFPVVTFYIIVVPYFLSNAGRLLGPVWARRLLVR